MILWIELLKHIQDLKVLILRVLSSKYGFELKNPLFRL